MDTTLSVVQSLNKEISTSLQKSLNQHQESSNRIFANAAPRSMHFIGSFSVYKMANGAIHINIPTGTDKEEKLDSIVKRVLNDEFGIDFQSCRVIENVVGMSNKVLEFYLPTK